MNPVTTACLLVLLGLLIAVYVRWCRRRFVRERHPDQRLEVVTGDGARLGLSYYEPRGDQVRRVEPVILCHGLGANRFDMDFDDETSLALYLARRGFPVYNLELRGRGYSRSGRLVPGHGFDDYIRYDVPDTIAFVREHSGCDRVHWVGHSMGGLVIYAHLARCPDAPLRSAVTIASPVRLNFPGWLRRILKPIARCPWLPPVLQARASFLLAPLVGHLYPRPFRVLLNPDNTAPHRVREAVANLASDISGGELRHFARLAATGRFESEDGCFDYRRGMASIRTPVLALAGSADLMATPAAVFEGFSSLGSPLKEFRVVGRATGETADFGHGDLLIGERVQDAVFAPVTEWLATVRDRSEKVPPPPVPGPLYSYSHRQAQLVTV